MTPSPSPRIQELQGPILVLGASGFVGANLCRYLLAGRSDVYGTTSQPSAWRLEGLPEASVISADLLVEENLSQLLERVKPKTVFDCVAYGAYSFENDSQLIFRTNLNFAVRLIEKLMQAGTVRYIHAGSSSEYGDQSAGPTEELFLRPNSPYAASKAAVSEWIYYCGKKLNFPCANLRLYSVYGPYEDASRLVPAIVSKGLEGGYPPLVDPEISRDFLYVDDSSEAFVSAALNLKPENYGESFNIGSGIKTSMAAMAAAAQELFGIKEQPHFKTMAQRNWDVADWYANPEKARRLLGWSARTPLREGLEKTSAWYKGLEDPEAYRKSSKRFGRDPVYSVSAVLACADAAQAIPALYAGLRAAFEKLNIHYEIIFVDDCSRDGSEELIRAISARDRNVVGLTQSRNFGSQAAFRRGMEIASKNACVLINANLQDPPELVADFVTKWKEGYEVVYGRRVKRREPFYIRGAYRLFYQIFDRFSYLAIPHDVGDFCLMDKRVVRSLLQFPERDLFIRGLRAFAGFRQIGVDYIQAEISSGLAASNFFKNLGRAKRGILSFSNTPLSLLSFLSAALFGVSCVLALGQIAVRILAPEQTPKGITTTLLVMVFFGSINLLAISVLGEYLATIFEEVKRRPHSIVRHVVKDGEVRAASEERLS